jgi:hypothetical protein
MRDWRVGLAVPGLLAGIVGTAAGAEVSCPDQLSVEQRAQAPDGWAVNYSGITPRLSGVTIFDGQPANRVRLKHARRRQTQRELILTWHLGHSPRNHYLQCSYERTTASISMPLPPGTTQCEVAYDLTSNLPGGAMPVKRMVCH